MVFRDFGQGRRFTAADLAQTALAAAGKAASGLWVDGACDIAFQNDPLPLDVDLRYGDCGEKGLGIGMQRVGEQFPVIRQFNDLPQIHDGNAFADMFYNT